MQIWYKDVAGYLQLSLLGDDGKPVSGQTVTYSVRDASDGSEETSGTLVYANNVYSKSVTLTTAGEYYVTYTTPAGYEDAIDIIAVKDYADYKATVTGMALEATSQLIKTETDKISSLVLDSAKIEKILQMETGRWKITANTMVFYEDDNLTEVATFDLYDASGNPTMTDVVERRVAE